MSIPNAERVEIAPEKILDYLLNREHPDGGSKAAWFHSLGYTREEWQLLSKDLKRVALDCIDFDTQKTRFGVKYKAFGEIGHPSHRPGQIITVWIVENDRPPRLVTAYPAEEK